MRQCNSRGLKPVMFAFLLTIALMQVSGCGGGGSSSDSAVPRGIAGSQARFAVVGDHLYAISGSSMQIFDVTTASDPTPWSTQYVGFGIETLFSHDHYLFIGSQNGVFIYDNSNALFPTKIGSLLHARSCDPVVVEGNYAYVTLRNDNPRCGGVNNQLDIIDLTEITQPRLIKSYAMQSPAGLGVDTGTIFVCDGSAGLKVFDVTNPEQIDLKDRIEDQNCYDLIPYSGHLVVSGYAGIYQYAYTLPEWSITELSVFQPEPQI